MRKRVYLWPHPRLIHLRSGAVSYFGRKGFSDSKIVKIAMLFDKTIAERHEIVYLLKE
jgi:hypothetical protein